MNNLIKTSTSNFDVIYLSYDEPNAEENWSDLLNKVPWAKRVHGVKGFDAILQHPALLGLIVSEKVGGKSLMKEKSKNNAIL